MAPRIVYRIQHIERQVGPFTTSGSYSPAGLHMNSMPVPWDDGLNDRVIRNRVFGWPSLEIMDEWVSDHDRKRLQRAMFILVTFMCPPGTFAEGDHQVVFDRDEAIALRRSRIRSRHDAQ